MLISRVINCKLVQPVCPLYINVSQRQTDGRTTYDSNTALALHASPGRNERQKHCFKYGKLFTE